MSVSKPKCRLAVGASFLGLKRRLDTENFALREFGFCAVLCCRLQVGFESSCVGLESERSGLESAPRCRC